MRRLPSLAFASLAVSLAVSMALGSAALARPQETGSRVSAGGLSDSDIAKRLGRLGADIVARERRLREARQDIEKRRRAAAIAKVELAEAEDRLRLLSRAAQRVAREPTPAMLLNPDKPIDAARSAMLLRRLARETTRQARRRSEEAARLQRALTSAQRIQDTLDADLVVLRAEEKDVKELQRRERQRAESAARRFKKRHAETVGDAAIGRLTGKDAKANRSEAAAPEKKTAKPARVDPPRAPTIVQPRPQNIVKAETARTAQPEAAPAPKRKKKAPPTVPKRPFSKSRGELLWPAAGDMRRSGRKNDPSVSLFTEPYARVIAPWRGKVLHADTISAHEKAVIIEPQKGYSIVIVGLETVDLRKGQWVAAGQPIGRMGGPKAWREEILLEGRTGAMKRSEKLDIALYRKQRALDPAPWFRSETERVSGL